MKGVVFPAITVLLVLLAACSQAGDTTDTAATSASAALTSTAGGLEEVPAPAPSEPPSLETAASSEETDASREESASNLVQTEESLPIASGTMAVEGQSDPSPPTAAADLEPAGSAPMPFEVTYFTPGQGEGPYYPVDKPEDRDNDLTTLNGAAGVPQGEVIEFGGKIYDAAGMPVDGIVIEIWQTDNSGVYLHPADPGTDQRDRNFQYYGETVTAADGGYSFRTILPGHYEQRPRHIHVKVKFEGQELLTTQFYFEGDPELADEAMFTQAEGDGVHLIISLTEGQDLSGQPIFMGQRDIILNVDFSG